MRQQFKPTVERLFVRPVRDLVDTTFELITRPASVAREFAKEDDHQFGRAITYFVAAFSAAVILEKIAAWSLGIETFSDAAYWAVNLLIIFSITALAALFAFVFASSPLVVLVKSACLAFGAFIAINGFLLAGISITLALLHKVGYIPDLKLDFTLLSNYSEVAAKANLDCLREESILFAYLYDGVGGRYEKLNHPLDEIAYLTFALWLGAGILFSVLMFHGSKRRQWAAAFAAILGIAVFSAGSLFGLISWSSYLKANTSCIERGITTASQTTANEYVSQLVEVYSGRVGRPDAMGIVLTGVDQKDKTVILRINVPELVNGTQGFFRWLNLRRRELISNYCSSEEEGAIFMRQAGLRFMSIFRYADTDLVETVVQSPDQCTR